MQLSSGVVFILNFLHWFQMHEISDQFFDACTLGFKLLFSFLPTWLVIEFKGQKQMKGKK
jgi:hypothetical protein